MNVHPKIFTATELIANGLTDAELAGLYMTACHDADPTSFTWYEKAQGLFTIEGGKKMHADVLAALDVIVEKRLR